MKTKSAVRVMAALTGLCVFLSMFPPARAEEDEASGKLEITIHFTDNYEEDLENGLLPDVQGQQGENWNVSQENEEDSADLSGYTNLTVGNPTPLQGDFFTALWGNATSDIDVRDLLHGCNLVYWGADTGRFSVNPAVVTGTAVMDSPQGDRTYILGLAEDLYFSDGKQITAYDYAFSYLLEYSPQIQEIGGNARRRDDIEGCQAYMDGTTPILSGVKIMGDFMLAITIRGEYLPFFYELGLLSCHPYPAHVIAPGVTVKDDGSGVYLADRFTGLPSVTFTADMLRSTILDPVSGYRSHPSVVSGPYMLRSFDGETAKFVRNPYYKGNTFGIKPSIPALTYTLAENDTMMEKLAAGELDLVNKAMREDSVQKGLMLAGGGTHLMSTYPRIGTGYISFACEKNTVASEAVRRAIALCTDRDAVVQAYNGSFGMRVDGYYGIGQWMYGIIAGTTVPPVEEPENPDDPEAQAAYEEAMSAYDALSSEMGSLNPYRLNTAEAIRLLEADGWLPNARGIREKIIDGKRVTLDMRLAYPEGNSLYRALQRHMVPYLAEAGIRVSTRAIPMAELMADYTSGERSYDMYLMASNFDLMFDPSLYFREAEDGTHTWQYTACPAETMYEYAMAMRRTSPGDVLGYMNQWVAFQKEFNAHLPMLPLYGNVYFDFYTQALHNYIISSSVSWGEAIVWASMYDTPAGEEEGEGMTEEENVEEEKPVFEE